MYKPQSEFDELYEKSYALAVKGGQGMTVCGTQDSARSMRRAFADRNAKSPVKMKLYIRKADDKHFVLIMKRADDEQPVPSIIKAQQQNEPTYHKWVIKTLTDRSKHYRTIPPLSDIKNCGGPEEWIAQTEAMAASILKCPVKVELIPLERLGTERKTHYMAVLKFIDKGE